jgi:PAS domain S-box-containing protein
VVTEKDDKDLVRRQNEETVAGTAESLLAFENAALPLAVILPAGRIAMANRAARSLLGYEFGEIVGMSIYDVVVSADRTNSWDERVDGGEPVTTEQRIRLRRKDGVEVAVMGSSLLVTDSEGAVRYVIAKAVLEPPR